MEYTISNPERIIDPDTGLNEKLPRISERIAGLTNYLEQIKYTGDDWNCGYAQALIDVQTYLEGKAIWHPADENN
jgi:hypothetical protein